MDLSSVPNENFFPLLYEKYFLSRTEPVMSCTGHAHASYGSPYPKDKVPVSLFINPHLDEYYKTCRHCREYIAKYRDILPEPDENGVYKCVSCSHMRTVEYCEKCAQRDIASTRRRKRHHNLVIWERIMETGTCCQLCNKSFKKKVDGSEGFITISGSIEEIGLTQDNFEYRNLEFDHLTEKEQIARFGRSYGPKKKGVGQILGYKGKKAEARKCLLVCLLCHRLKTLERYGVVVKKRTLVQQKIDYVNKKKCEIGCCQICKFAVDQSILSYFEFDHINQKTKLETISHIAKGHSKHQTMAFLVDEMGKCRLLCAYCHRIHNSIQQTDRFSTARTGKIAKFKKVMSVYEESVRPGSKRGRSTN